MDPIEIQRTGWTRWAKPVGNGPRSVATAHLVNKKTATSERWGVGVFLSEACRWEIGPLPDPFFGLPSIVAVTRLTVRRYLRRLAIATDGAHAAVVRFPLSKERVIEATVRDTASDAGPSLSAAAPITSLGAHRPLLPPLPCIAFLYVRQTANPFQTVVATMLLGGLRCKPTATLPPPTVPSRYRTVSATARPNRSRPRTPRACTSCR